MVTDTKGKKNKIRRKRRKEREEKADGQTEKNRIKNHSKGLKAHRT